MSLIVAENWFFFFKQFDVIEKLTELLTSFIFLSSNLMTSKNSQNYWPHSFIILIPVLAESGQEDFKAKEK